MGRNIDSPIHSYEAAHEAFQAAEQRSRRSSLDALKLAGNTYLVPGPAETSFAVGDPSTFSPCGQTRPAYYAVRLHNTNVVTFYSNGDVTLDTGGWKTKTPLHRMRGFFPGSEWPAIETSKRRAFLRWSLGCKAGEWSVDCERIEYVPAADPSDTFGGRYERTPVKSYPFSRTLTLQRSRTAGGYKLKRSEALA